MPASPTPTLLHEQGALQVREHLILLGEGTDTSFLFYSYDFPNPANMGLFFSLVPGLWATPGDGIGNTSPKPAAMTIAAMTQILDGTVTLGPLTGGSLPANAYAYAFQRTGGPVVTALWAYAKAYGASIPYELTVGGPGTNGTLIIIDSMGNAATASYTNGKLGLTLGDLPQYVVSTDVPAIAAQVTVPEGYAPEL